MAFSPFQSPSKLVPIELKIERNNWTSKDLKFSVNTLKSMHVRLLYHCMIV